MKRQAYRIVHGVRQRRGSEHLSATTINCRGLSEWNQRGHDITMESLTSGNRPKILLQGYAPTGFDVFHCIKRVQETDSAWEMESGTLHLNGSILAFPHACFLWKVAAPTEITLESLAPALLYRPKLEYLFLGCSEKGLISGTELDHIRRAFQPQGVVVETMSLANAMGTFNLLNAEDRPVAAALVMDRSTNEE